MLGIDHDFKKVKFQQWGPWRNHWGYETTIADFGNEDIVVKTLTPYKTKVVKNFSDWEECEDYIEQINQDRRF